MESSKTRENKGGINETYQRDRAITADKNDSMSSRFLIEFCLIYFQDMQVSLSSHYRLYSENEAMLCSLLCWVSTLIFLEKVYLG